MTAPAAPPAPRRRRLFRLAAFVLPLLGLLALEGVLRVVGYEHPVGAPFLKFVNPDQLMTAGEDGPGIDDPLLFWRMRPGWREGPYHASDQGYRTPPFSVAKPPGTTRIVCLGDSTTFGLGADFAACWTRRLESNLRERRGTDAVEVISLGVPGYSVVQGDRLLESEGLALSPDVVVLAFGGFNDWLPAVGYPDSQQGRSAWWQELRVPQLAHHLIVPPSGTPAAPETASEARSRLKVLDTSALSGPRRVPLEEFEQTLTRAANRARRAGAKVVLLTNALPQATVERNPIATDYADAIRRVARSGGFVLVDGWSVFAMPDRAELFFDFCHPGPKGHAALAEALAEAIE